MAIVFPASPSVNETFTAGSITYKWDGDKWIGLGVTPADRLVEGSNSLEINANNDLIWSGGDVGIGSSGGYKLHLKQSSQTFPGGLSIERSDNTNKFGIAIDGNTALNFGYNDSTRVLLDSTGNLTLTQPNTAFTSQSSSSGDYVRMYAGAGTAQWDIYGNGELLRMGDNSGSATARVQFDNPTLHRSTATTTGVAALTAKQEVNNGGYLIYEGLNSSDTTVFSVTHNGTVSDSMGPLRRLGANTQSGAYTLDASDAGKYVAQSSNSASVTVPNAVFSAGDMVTIVNLTATNINIVQGTGLDLNFTADGTTGTRTLAAKGVCTILFVSSGTSFISGSGLS